MRIEPHPSRQTQGGPVLMKANAIYTILIACVRFILLMQSPASRVQGHC